MALVLGSIKSGTGEKPVFLIDKHHFLNYLSMHEKEAEMYKFKWAGNDGRCFHGPGTVQQAKCGICGTKMNVERNVRGFANWAEAVADKTHLHDHFTCPHLLASWHKKIFYLKWEAHAHSVRIRSTKGIKNALEKKVKKILAKAEKQR